MQSQSGPLRQRYQPDGVMPASGWSPLFVSGLGLSLAGGWTLNALLQKGWFLIILVPGVMGLLLGIALALAVARTRCRNPLIAGATGAAAGVTMYLAYFYFGMLGELPKGNAHRLDLLPGYVAARLKNDIAQKIGPGPAPNQPQAKPDRFGNYLALGIELTLVVMLTAFAPALRARRPYVPELGQWMSREERRFPAGLEPEFRNSLETGQLDQFVRRMLADGPGLAKAQIAKHYGSCVLEYVRHPQKSPLEYPVYLTFINDAASLANSLQAFVFRGRDTLNQVQLEPHEIISLRPLYPHLNRILTAFQIQPGVARVAAPIPRTEAVTAASRGEAATIRPVDQGGTLRSGRFLLIVNLLGLLPLAAFVGGLALLVAGACGWPIGELVAVRMTTAAFGLVLLIGGFVYAQRYPGTLEAWYARRKLLGILLMRPDPIVTTNNADAEMVNLTRRENWTKLQLDVRDDVGLVEIDKQRGELRIEGDQRRYRIPFPTIRTCAPECFHHVIDKNLLTQYWYVRLVVWTGEQEEELLFAPVLSGWQKRNNDTRRLAAQDLCTRIAG